MVLRVWKIDQERKASIDRALAACLQGNPHLTSLKVYVLGDEPYTPFPVPVLYETVKQNFVIQNIKLCYILDSDKNIVPRGTKIVVRLNREGRAYMLADKMNRSKGIDLLGRVSDSLDCLFFHLRENSSLIMVSHQHDTKQYDSTNKRKRGAC